MRCVCSIGRVVASALQIIRVDEHHIITLLSWHKVEVLGPNAAIKTDLIRIKPLNIYLIRCVKNLIAHIAPVADFFMQLAL